MLLIRNILILSESQITFTCIIRLSSQPVGNANTATEKNILGLLWHCLQETKKNPETTQKLVR